MRCASGVSLPFASARTGLDAPMCTQKCPTVAASMVRSDGIAAMSVACTSAWIPGARTMAVRGYVPLQVYREGYGVAPRIESPIVPFRRQKGCSFCRRLREIPGAHGRFASCVHSATVWVS